MLLVAPLLFNKVFSPFLRLFPPFLIVLMLAHLHPPPAPPADLLVPSQHPFFPPCCFPLLILAKECTRNEAFVFVQWASAGSKLNRMFSPRCPPPSSPASPSALHLFHYLQCPPPYHPTALPPPLECSLLCVNAKVVLTVCSCSRDECEFLHLCTQYGLHIENTHLFSVFAYIFYALDAGQVLLDDVRVLAPRHSMSLIWKIKGKSPTGNLEHHQNLNIATLAHDQDLLKTSQKNLLRTFQAISSERPQKSEPTLSQHQLQCNACM